MELALEGEEEAKEEGEKEEEVGGEEEERDDVSFSSDHALAASLSLPPATPLVLFLGKGGGGEEEEEVEGQALSSTFLLRSPVSASSPSDCSVPRFKVSSTSLASRRLSLEGDEEGEGGEELALVSSPTFSTWDRLAVESRRG